MQAVQLNLLSIEISMIFYHSKRKLKIINILPIHVKKNILEIPTYGKSSYRIKAFYTLFKVTSRSKQVILVDVTMYAFWFAIFLKKIFGIFIILRCRGGVISECNYGNRNKIICLAEKYCIKQADHYICVSNYLKKRLVEDGVNENKISVVNVPNMIERQAFSNNEKDTFLLVTNFHFQKKVELLPLYLNFLTDYFNENNLNYKIKIVGDGKYLQSVKNEIKDLNYIEFMGAVSADTIQKLLRQTKIFLHFSSLDAFPTSLQEAMAYGIPIIANKFGGMPEIVTHGFTGYLVDSPNDIHSYLYQLLNDDNLYNSMCTNSLEETKKWDKEILTKEIESVFTRVGVE
jgi:glycosyltransferase involved in cell wall biosynthesis